MLPYMNFPCADLDLTDGTKIHLIFIPAGNPWGKSMGIDDETIQLTIGKPYFDEYPPNTAFLRQEMLSMKDFPLRIINLVRLYEFLSPKYKYAVRNLGPDLLCSTEGLSEQVKDIIERAIENKIAG
jgi:hypothetical protein